MQVTSVSLDSTVIIFSCVFRLIVRTFRNRNIFGDMSGVSANIILPTLFCHKQVRGQIHIFSRDRV